MISDWPFMFRNESTKKLVWSSVCKSRSSFRVIRQWVDRMLNWLLCAGLSLHSHSHTHILEIWSNSLEEFFKVFAWGLGLWGCKYLKVYIKAFDFFFFFLVFRFRAHSDSFNWSPQNVSGLSLSLPCIIICHSSIQLWSSKVLTDSCPLVFIRFFKNSLFIFKISKEEKETNTCE